MSPYMDTSLLIADSKMQVRFDYIYPINNYNYFRSENNVNMYKQYMTKSCIFCNGNNVEPVYMV